MAVVQQVVDSLIEQVKRSVSRYISRTEAYIQEYARKVVSKVIRLLVLAGVGVTLLAVGLIFILVGAVDYLRLFVAAWMAWGLIGVIIAVAGGAMLAIAIRKRF